MSIPIEWLSAVDLAGAWLSTYLLHSSVLLLAALGLARWAGSRHLPLQESLLRVAVVGGLLTATLQTGLGWEPAAGSIPYPTLAASTEQSVPVDRESTVASGVSDLGLRSAESTTVPTPVAAAAGPNTGSAVGSAIGSGIGLDAAALGRSWLAVAVALWVAGGLLLTGRLLLLAATLRRRLAERSDIRSGSLFRLFWRLLASADIDRPTRLTRCDRLQVPIALGLARREICLPRRVVRDLPAEQQETVLAHELAHLERRDPVWLLIVRLIESLLFVQPLNRLARRRLQELAEYGCDDWAARHTGRPDTLARCLTEVASWSAEEPVFALAPTMANRSGLGRRVRRLLTTDHSYLELRPPAWWRPLAAAALLIVVLAVPGFTVLGQEAAPEPPAAPEAAAAAEALARPEPVPSPEVGEAPQALAPRAAIPASPSPRPTAAPRATVAPEPESAAKVAEEVRPAPSAAPAAEAVPAPEVAPVPPVEPAPLAEEDGSAVVAPEPEVIEIEVVAAPRVVARIDSRQVVRPAPRVRHVTEIRRVAHAGGEIDEACERDHESEISEEEFEAFEEDLEAALEALEETMEHDLESALEGLDEEMELLEKQLEDGLEGELERFEEDLEVEMESLERDMERREQEIERRLEAEGDSQREERREKERERVERRMEALGEQLERDLEGVERRLQSFMEARFEPVIESELQEHVEAMTRRVEAESRQLEAMAREIARRHRAEGTNRLDAEERERLTAEARRLAEMARPSAEEIEALRAMARDLRPSAAELEEMRRELAEELEVVRRQVRERLEVERRALDELDEAPPLR